MKVSFPLHTPSPRHDYMKRMKQRLTGTLRWFPVLLLALFVTLPAHAQKDDDDDITYSLNLNEVVVLADGMTFEEYLVKQVLTHAKPLKAYVQTLRYSVTCQLEKDIDLTKFPHRRTITFAARLAGYGKILDALREHKHFGITMAEDILYDKGKITTSNARMVAMEQELTPKQQAAFLKHDGMMSANVYDQFYKKVREKAKELQKKHKKKKDTDMSYSGSYTVGNRTFYVVKLDNMRVHIADGCWQIARISYSEGQNRMQYEFKEIRPNLFVASQGSARFYLDKEKWPKGYVSMKMNYIYD